MFIVRTPTKRICSLIYLDKSEPNIDQLIMSLNSYTDVYVYITKSSDINPVKYSSLMNIYGYIQGSKDELHAMYELLSDVYTIVDYYSIFYIPEKTTVVSSEKIFNIAYMKGLIVNSIFRSKETDYGTRSDIYKVKGWKEKLKSLFNHNDNENMYFTHLCDSEIVLLLSDVKKLMDVTISSTFIDTFNKVRFSDFIASAFNYLNLKFINSNLYYIVDMSNPSVKA